MEIYPRGKRGTWWVRFTRPDGKRVHQSTRTTDRIAAQEYADKLKAQSWRTSQLGERPRRSWQEAVVRWLKETHRKRTHGDDKAKLKWLHSHLGKLMLDQITAQTVADIRDAILAGRGPGGGSSPGTAAKYLALIRSILRKAAGEWEWIDRAPTVKMPKVTHQEGFRWLRRDQADQLLKALDKAGLNHTADMARLALATGMRETNVTGLTWGRVDLGKRIAWVDQQDAKASKAMGIPLNDTAVQVIRARRFKHPERVFTFQGRPIHRANTRKFREVLKAEGLRPHPGRDPGNFRWHDLRHTWASWHVMEGTPLEVLQRLGGWASLDMVLRYAHLAPSHVAAYAGNVDSGPKTDQIQKEGKRAAGDCGISN